MGGSDIKNGRVVIVGAGHAGGTAAALLRQYGWQGSITLVGDEPVPPYQRPPLSKQWLKNELGSDGLALRPDSFYASNAITLHLSQPVTRIDRASREVKFGSRGEALPYDHLVIALGSRARRLDIPGAELAGVMELRSVADADRLKQALQPARHIAVVGGGYIGLEAAASARLLGARATIIERENRFLARVASPALSEFFEVLHRAHGVELLTGAAVEALEGTAGHVSAVRLGDGRSIECDFALVGVGALANDEIAAAAGLDCDNGIIVDHEARTSDPAVFAIGDCTRRPLPLYSRMWRLESVPNALEQAKQAASALCGRPPPRSEVPWFWSDQYDVRLQIAGLPFEVCQLVIRGDPNSGSFAVFHLNADSVLQAVEAVNAAPEFMAGRLMIGRQTKVATSRLADLTLSMKDIAAS